MKKLKRIIAVLLLFITILAVSYIVYTARQIAYPFSDCLQAKKTSFRGLLQRYSEKHKNSTERLYYMKYQTVSIYFSVCHFALF